MNNELNGIDTNNSRHDSKDVLHASTAVVVLKAEAKSVTHEWVNSPPNCLPM